MLKAYRNELFHHKVWQCRQDIWKVVLQLTLTVSADFDNDSFDGTNDDKDSIEDTSDGDATYPIKGKTMDQVMAR